MAMIHTLVISAKEWLSEQFCQNRDSNAGAAEAQKDEVRQWFESGRASAKGAVTIPAESGRASANMLVGVGRAGVLAGYDHVHRIAYRYNYIFKSM